MVKDINPSGAGVDTSSWGPEFTVVNGKLFFVADNGTAGQELWISDGTPDGTNMVKDIRPGAMGSEPYGLYAGGTRLFFGADDGSGSGCRALGERRYRRRHPHGQGYLSRHQRRATGGTTARSTIMAYFTFEPKTAQPAKSCGVATERKPVRTGSLTSTAGLVTAIRITLSRLAAVSISVHPAAPTVACGKSTPWPSLPPQLQSWLQQPRRCRGEQRRQQVSAADRVQPRPPGAASPARPNSCWVRIIRILQICGRSATAHWQTARSAAGLFKSITTMPKASMPPLRAARHCGLSRAEC